MNKKDDEKRAALPVEKNEGQYAALAQETAAADDWKNDPDYPYCTGSFLRNVRPVTGARIDANTVNTSGALSVQFGGHAVICADTPNVPVRIFFAGDSTAQYNSARTYPQTGWVQVLGLFASNAQIINYSKNGRSTKSFIDEGRFDSLVSQLRVDDFVFFQFGHNDEKVEDPLRGTEPYGSFTENLLYFAETVRRYGAHPVFLTPITRRLFSDGGAVKDSHGQYSQAMQEAAKKCGALCIEMNAETIRILNTYGEVQSRRFYMFFEPGEYENYPQGKKDNSHLRYEGAVMTAQTAVRLLRQAAEKTEPDSPYHALLPVFTQNNAQ